MSQIPYFDIMFLLAAPAVMAQRTLPWKGSLGVAIKTYQ